MSEKTTAPASDVEAMKHYAELQGVRLAYGEPVELGGERVVPVAFWAGGAGGGEGHDESGGGGEGAGYGGVALPLGVYVGDAYGVRFRPNLIALLAVLTPLSLVAGWALPRLIKALKR